MLCPELQNGNATAFKIISKVVALFMRYLWKISFNSVDQSKSIFVSLSKKKQQEQWNNYKNHSMPEKYHLTIYSLKLSSFFLFTHPNPPRTRLFDVSNGLQLVILKVRYSEGSLFWRFVIPKVRYFEGLLFRRFVNLKTK